LPLACPGPAASYFFWQGWVGVVYYFLLIKEAPQVLLCRKWQKTIKNWSFHENHVF